MKISRGEFATRIPFAKKSCVFLSENHRKWSFDESPGPDWSKFPLINFWRLVRSSRCCWPSRCSRGVALRPGCCVARGLPLAATTVAARNARDPGVADIALRSSLACQAGSCALARARRWLHRRHTSPALSGDLSSAAGLRSPPGACPRRSATGRARATTPRCTRAHPRFFSACFVLRAQPPPLTPSADAADGGPARRSRRLPTPLLTLPPRLRHSSFFFFFFFRSPPSTDYPRRLSSPTKKSPERDPGPHERYSECVYSTK